MTIQGAINELFSLLNANDIPVYYKASIKKVIETIDDYVNEKDDYVMRRMKQFEQPEPLPCHRCESALSSECTICDGQQYFRTEEIDPDCGWR